MVEYNNMNNLYVLKWRNTLLYVMGHKRYHSGKDTTFSYHHHLWGLPIALRKRKKNVYKDLKERECHYLQTVYV